MRRTWYAMAYDIADDRARGRVADLLLDHGDRVQFSLFECHLTSTERDALWLRLQALINPRTDRLRLYAICGQCWSRGQIVGRDMDRQPTDFIVV